MSVVIGKDVQQCYDTIIAGDAATTWGVFGYEGQSELKVQATGADDLSEFPDEFSDGRLQYAFMKVLEPNSKLPKFVLIGWCGDGAPRKGVFQQHFSSVASKLTGYHVQITARSDEDVSEENIMKKVEDASGAKYSMSAKSSPFGETRKPTTNSLVNQLKGQSAPAFNVKKPAQTEPRLPPTASKIGVFQTTKPATKPKTDNWETPKTNEHGRISVEEAKDPEKDEPVNEPVKSAYQPIGRPDINALRAQGESQNPSLSSQGTGSAYKPVEVPKTGSLADRMAAFSGNKPAETSGPSPRKASNPLASRFGGAISGTKAAVPTTATRESQALGGLARNFGSEGGKTPSQLWAERKARERGESIPEPVKEPPVKATTYDEPTEETSSVSGIRDKFAQQSIQDEETHVPQAVALPPPPHMPAREATPEVEENEEDYEEAETSSSRPPPAPMNTRPAATIPPPAPARVETPEPEAEPEREPSPEPEPMPAKNSFKAQLEQSLGGGAPAAAAAHAPVAPALDTHAGSKSSAPRAKAVYEYEAQEDNEIGFAEGEVVTDIEMIDEGWWSGRNEAGATGLFPSNYVELITTGGEDEEESSQHAPSAHHEAEGTSASAGSGLCATAVYEYEAAEEGEIGFAEGERIEEIDQIDEGWWKGKNARGEEGLFPANYVELQQ